MTLSQKNIHAGRNHHWKDVFRHMAMFFWIIWNYSMYSNLCSQSWKSNILSMWITKLFRFSSWNYFKNIPQVKRPPWKSVLENTGRLVLFMHKVVYFLHFRLEKLSQLFWNLYYDVFSVRKIQCWMINVLFIRR